MVVDVGLRASSHHTSNSSRFDRTFWLWTRFAVRILRLAMSSSYGPGLTRPQVDCSTALRSFVASCSRKRPSHCAITRSEHGAMRCGADGNRTEVGPGAGIGSPPLRASLSVISFICFQPSATCARGASFSWRKQFRLNLGVPGEALRQFPCFLAGCTSVTRRVSFNVFCWSES